MAEQKKSKLDPETEKLAQQFDKFDEDIKSMTQDRMNQAPKQDVEPQTKLSQSQIEKSKEIYLKPHRTIGANDKFNEKFREAFNFDKEYVHFIAENREIVGETIDIWTRPYGGMPAEWWKVPVNTPVWGPRYLAQQIKSCTYHRLVMQEDKLSGSDNKGNQYFGTMAVDTTVQRLDAHPVSSKKSVFMGKNLF